MPYNFGPDSPFYEFLEGDPSLGQRTAYFGQQGQWRTPAQRKYFQGQFNEIQNEYLGRLGQQILGEGTSSLRFTDFLSQMPWTQRFAQLPPSMRGENTSLFAPPTRWRV